MANVLLIDDCDELREMVEDLLSDEGHTVFSAAEPNAAEVACRDAKFDIILCDLVMPLPPSAGENEANETDAHSAMVGVHAIKDLSSRYPNVPVVAMSGALTGEPLEMMRQFGAVNVLSKPFGRDELIKALSQALAR